MLNYSVKVFQQAGLEGTTANWADFTIKVVNCLMTIVAMILVDRKGRKFLLKIGTAGIVVGLLGTGFLFNNVEKARKDVTTDVAALLAAQSPSVQKEFDQGKDVGSIRNAVWNARPIPLRQEPACQDGMGDKDINRMRHHHL
ncbi:MAG: MFS transporter [Akkermansia sp.]